MRLVIDDSRLEPLGNRRRKGSKEIESDAVEFSRKREREKCVVEKEWKEVVVIMKVNDDRKGR